MEHPDRVHEVATAILDEVGETLLCDHTVAGMLTVGTLDPETSTITLEFEDGRDVEILVRPTRREGFFALSVEELSKEIDNG